METIILHKVFKIAGLPKRLRKRVDKPRDCSQRWCFNRHSGQGFLIMVYSMSESHEHCRQRWRYWKCWQGFLIMLYSMHICHEHGFWWWYAGQSKHMQLCNANHDDIMIKIIHDYLPMTFHRFSPSSNPGLMLSRQTRTSGGSPRWFFIVVNLFLFHRHCSNAMIVHGQVYMDLKRKGVEFPTPSDEDLLLVQSRQPATVCFPFYFFSAPLLSRDSMLPFYQLRQHLMLNTGYFLSDRSL